MGLSAIIDVIEQLVLDKAEPSTIKGNLERLRDQAAALERDAKPGRYKARLKDAELQIERLQLEVDSEKQKAKAEISNVRLNAEATIARMNKEAGAEANRLQTELEKANKEVKRLKDGLSAIEQRLSQRGSTDDDEDDATDDLEIDAGNILMQIAESPYTARTIARALKLHPALVQHHLDAMNEKGFVNSGTVLDEEGNERGVEWMANKIGRAWLVNAGFFGDR